MTLSAVLVDFSGVIIQDEPLHEKLVADLLLSENLRPQADDYWSVCLGRSDREGLQELFHRRGRLLSETMLQTLVAKKSQAYLQAIAGLPKLPIYPALADLLFQVRGAGLPLAIVSEANRAEIEAVLSQAQLQEFFPVIISAEDVAHHKPAPDAYALAIQRLNERQPNLHLQPAQCLAIEDTYPGITAAKAAGILVAGVAHTHPLHMIQRRATWAVDYLNELDLDWLRQRYEGRRSPQTVESV